MKTDSQKTRVLFCFVSALLLLLPLLILQNVRGDEPSKDENAKKARELIERLGYKDVIIKGWPRSRDPYLVIPKNFKWKHQEINENIDKLIKMGLDAFPELVAHLDDDRLCGFEVIEVETPIRVGTVCSNIIKCQICVFEYDVRDKEMWQWEPHPLGEDDSGEFKGFDAKKWWEKNRNKSLCELQIDAAKKSLNILKNTKKNRRSDFWGTDRRKEYQSWRTKQIKGLESLIKELEETNKPKPIEGSLHIGTIRERDIKKVGDEDRVYFGNGK